MKQYYDLIKLILATGEQLPNRTGIDTIMIPGAMMTFNMKDGFPLLGGRFVPFKSMIAELCGFYRGYTSAEDFRKLGCKVWDKNANDPGKEGHRNAWLDNPFRDGEDSLGPIYGAQWRSWPGYKLVEFGDDAIIKQIEKDGWALVDEVGSGATGLNGRLQLLYYKEIDQLSDCIRTIIQNPSSRRILFHGWNPAVLDEVALPACHLLYQFLPNPKTKVLNLVTYLRSSDGGLGLPYNQAQSAAQLHFIARLTGYTSGSSTMFLADSHVYIDQIEWLQEQIAMHDAGLDYDLPTIEIDERIPDCSNDPEAAVAWLEKVEPEDFRLINYKYHVLTTPAPAMAV